MKSVAIVYRCSGCEKESRRKWFLKDTVFQVSRKFMLQNVKAHPRLLASRPYCKKCRTATFQTPDWEASERLLSRERKEIQS